MRFLAQFLALRVTFAFSFLIYFSNGQFELDTNAGDNNVPKIEQEAPPARELWVETSKGNNITLTCPKLPGSPPAVMELHERIKTNPGDNNVPKIEQEAPPARELWVETSKGNNITLTCPKLPGSPPAVMELHERIKTNPELTDDDMISDTGFIVLANVNENDSKMYVCAVPGVKDYVQVRIHVKVQDKSLYSSQKFIYIPSFRRFPIVGAAAKAKRRQQKKKRRKKYQTEDETTTLPPSTTATATPTTTDLAENPDNPPGAKPEELEEYKKRTELRKSLYPPSKPKLVLFNDTAVQVKWSINIMLDHPVKYFTVQYLDKNRKDDVIGGGSECHNAEKIPAVLYFHNFDRLQPGHSYQFRVAAVYDVPDEISVLGRSSEWIDIE